MFAHSCICKPIYVYVRLHVSLRHAHQPVTHGPAATATAAAACAVSVSAGWQGERRTSLWLTQAERGFLHIFCHAIWALVSVAARSGPTWQHKVETDICSFNLLVKRENNLQTKLSVCLLNKVYCISFKHVFI